MPQMDLLDPPKMDILLANWSRPHWKKSILLRPCMISSWLCTSFNNSLHNDCISYIPWIQISIFILKISFQHFWMGPHFPICFMGLLYEPHKAHSRTPLLTDELKCYSPVLEPGTFEAPTDDPYFATGLIVANYATESQCKRYVKDWDWWVFRQNGKAKMISEPLQMYPSKTCDTIWKQILLQYWYS